MRLPALFLLSVLPSLAQPQPGPAALRNQAIEETRKAIQQECALAAKGDWNAWHNSVRPYRKELLKLAIAAAGKPIPSRLDPAKKHALLFWNSDKTQVLPVNEALSIANIDDNLDTYLAGDRVKPTALKLTEWFRARGIDLIFFPIPTKADIYPEELVPDQSLVPANRNVIPAVRRKLVELLGAGVEVVDIYPSFMKMRETAKRPLFMAADKHWREEPQKLAGELLAERLSRYPWIREAQESAVLFQQVQTPYIDYVSFLDYLSAEQRQAVEPGRPGFYQDVTPLMGSKIKPIADHSPVLITGDSFISYSIPDSGAMAGHLAQRINMPVTTRQLPGNTVQTFRDMFRDPSILKDRKVVIWVINYEPLEENGYFPETFNTPPVRPN